MTIYLEYVGDPDKRPTQIGKGNSIYPVQRYPHYSDKWLAKVDKSQVATLKFHLGSNNWKEYDPETPEHIEENFWFMVKANKDRVMKFIKDFAMPIDDPEVKLEFKPTNKARVGRAPVLKTVKDTAES